MMLKKNWLTQTPGGLLWGLLQRLENRCDEICCRNRVRRNFSEIVETLWYRDDWPSAGRSFRRDLGKWVSQNYYKSVEVAKSWLLIGIICIR
jgi:hypothetical protein